MFKNVKSLLLTLTSAAVLAVPLFAPSIVAASAITDNLCAGSNLSISSTTSCTGTTNADSTLQNILDSVVKYFSLIVGFVSVIMIIFGGFKYITSGGDSNNISSAKNTIIFALVGLIIVALAQVIVHFVLAKATTVGS